MILFDPETARDLRDALRILEGRLRGTGRRLSPGALEIVRAAERSGAVPSGQPSPLVIDRGDDHHVLRLLTLQEVADLLASSESTVRRLAASGELLTVSIGRSVRVRPTDLKTYIDTLPTGTNEQERDDRQDERPTRRDHRDAA